MAKRAEMKKAKKIPAKTPNLTNTKRKALISLLSELIDKTILQNVPGTIPHLLIAVHTLFKI
jgi:hypothetical protein